jgi:hypothetical protein
MTILFVGSGSCAGGNQALGRLQGVLELEQLGATSTLSPGGADVGTCLVS